MFKSVKLYTVDALCFHIHCAMAWNCWFNKSIFIWIWILYKKTKPGSCTTLFFKCYSYCHFLLVQLTSEWENKSVFKVLEPKVQPIHHFPLQSLRIKQYSIWFSTRHAWLGIHSDFHDGWSFIHAGGESCNGSTTTYVSECAENYAMQTTSNAWHTDYLNFLNPESLSVSQHSLMWSWEMPSMSRMPSSLLCRMRPLLRPGLTMPWILLCKPWPKWVKKV